MNHPLKQFEGPFKTSMGAVFIGERAVFRGVDVHTAFRDAMWMELYVYGITGQRMAANQLRVLEGLWTHCSYPDGRLWNNRIAALAGTARSTSSAAIGAALAVTDAAIIGGQTIMAACDFLQRALKRRQAGEALEAIIHDERTRNRQIKGFGRTMHADKMDERLPWALYLLKREGIEPGNHFKLAFEIETALSQITGHPLPMTYAAIIASIGLDMGFTPEQFYHMNHLITSAGMQPCYLEAKNKPEGTTFVLSCERIHYTGPARRKWED